MVKKAISPWWRKFDWFGLNATLFECFNQESKLEVIYNFICEALWGSSDVCFFFGPFMGSYGGIMILWGKKKHRGGVFFFSWACKYFGGRCVDN